MYDDNEINSYLENLPKKIQDFIFLGNWEEKVGEISRKYSLNAEQGEKLSNIVILVLSLIINPEDVKSNITQDLKISDLLADQIILEIESRIFEPAVKQIETISPEQKTKLPEIRPDNTPVVGNNFIPPKPQLQNEALDKQKPTFVSVPRYAENTTSGNIIEKKLNAITGSIKETPPVKYEKDPYRESLG